jgi:hypothetical protein
MKRIFIILLFSFSIVTLGTSFSHAAGSVDAVVLENSHCVLDGDASSIGIPLITYEVIKEVTPKGNARLICIFNIPQGALDKAERIKDEISCRIPTDNGSVYTTDTLLVSTPGGKAVLTCKYKPEES